MVGFILEFALSQQIKELIEENIQKEPKKKSATKTPKTQANGKPTVGTSAQAKLQITRRESRPETFEEKPQGEKQKISLAEHLKKSFDTVKGFTKGTKHPTKDGLTCTEVYDLVPDLQNILKEYPDFILVNNTRFYVLKTEAFTDTLKSKVTK
jgi:hypothetical protein